ncbi:MAG: trypsin-like peptidase domain-containing protein, partial [Planctomycetales bacterium]
MSQTLLARIPSRVVLDAARSRSETTRFFCSIAKAAVSPILLTAILAALVASPQASAQEETEVTGLQVALAMEQATVAAIAKCEKSVVSIARIRRDFFNDNQLGRFNAFNQGGIRAGPRDPDSEPDFIPSRFGTGVIIDSTGKILTNYHVVDEFFSRDENEIVGDVEDKLIVWTHERRPYNAHVLAADPRSDLAGLQLDFKDDRVRKAANLTPIPMGDGSAVKKGQFVIALGNPHAIARDGSPSASWGIVANVARKLDPGPGIKPNGEPKRWMLYHHGQMIQTDAKLNLGTSGGALINLRGEMIGLTSSLAALAGFDQAAGYAIPVNESFRWIVDRLKDGKEA